MGQANTPAEFRQERLKLSMQAQQKMVGKNPDYDLFRASILSQNEARQRRNVQADVQAYTTHMEQRASGIEAQRMRHGDIAAVGRVSSTRNLHLKLHPYRATVEMVDESSKNEWESYILKTTKRIIELHEEVFGKVRTLLLGTFEYDRLRRFFKGPEYHEVECVVPWYVPISAEKAYLKEAMKPVSEQNFDCFRSELANERGEVKEELRHLPIHRMYETRTVKEAFPYFTLQGIPVLQAEEEFIIDAHSEKWIKLKMEGIRYERYYS